MLSVWNLGNEPSWTTAGQDCIVRGAAQNAWSLFSALMHPTSPCLKEPPSFLKKLGEMIWATLRKQAHVTNRYLGKTSWKQQELHGDAAQLPQAMAWPQGCVCAPHVALGTHPAVSNTGASLPGMVAWKTCTVVSLHLSWCGDFPGYSPSGRDGHSAASAACKEFWKWKKIRRSLSCCCSCDYVHEVCTENLLCNSTLQPPFYNEAEWFF